MTRTKALEIIKKAIENKGADFTVVLYYDFYAYKMQRLKNLVNGREKAFTDKRKFLCLKMTLKSLSEIIEKNGVNTDIGDNEQHLMASLLCREIEKDAEKFKKNNYLFAAYNEESAKKLWKYYEDNREAIDKLLGA